MDAMRHPTPLLRIALAICLCVRFLSSVMARAIYKYPAEQARPSNRAKGLTCYVANRRHHATMPPPPLHLPTPHRMHMLTCCAFAAKWPLLLEG